MPFTQNRRQSHKRNVVLKDKISIKFVFSNSFLVCPIWLPVYFLFYIMNQNWVQELILAWLWHHFHLALDGDQTQDSDHEPSALPLEHSFYCSIKFVDGAILELRLDNIHKNAPLKNLKRIQSYLRRNFFYRNGSWGYLVLKRLNYSSIPWQYVT